jgi:hypothetical protein
MNNYVEVGTALLISLHMKNTNNIEKHVVKVRKIISPGVILLDKTLGFSVEN